VEGSLLDLTVVRPVAFFTWNAQTFSERFRRRDFGHLDVEMTFDDPQMYNKPFTVKIPHNLMADADIFEDSCDNERDRAHLVKK